MADNEYPTLGRRRPPVERCWMCGIGLPVMEMVADGNSTWGDIRWYCLDVRACTERWTTRPARPGPGRGHGEETSSQGGAELLRLASGRSHLG
jgi:hypothetical protein